MYNLSDVILEVKTKLKEKIVSNNKDRYETLYNIKHLKYFENLSEIIVNYFNKS